MSKGFDNCISHDNILFLGDFNSQSTENYVNDFYNVSNLSNLVKEPACFKIPDRLHRFVFNKQSKMFSKLYDHENRDLRFPQNGNYNFKKLSQEIKTKNHSPQKL